MYDLSLSRTVLALTGIQELLMNATDYATKNEDKWVWSQDKDLITFIRPCFRSVKGFDHTMFVLDIDTYPEEDLKNLATVFEIREISLRVVTTIMDIILAKDPNFLCYLSGKKGGYMIRKVKPNVSPRRFMDVIMTLLPECPIEHPKDENSYCENWHLSPKKYWCYRKVKFMGDEFDMEVAIDLNMILKEGRHVFRLPYSLYEIQGKTLVCPLVSFGKDGKIDFERTLDNSIIDKVTVVDFEIPIMELKELKELKELNDTHEFLTVRQVKSSIPALVNYDIPLPKSTLSPRDLDMLEKIELMLTGPPETTPPCIHNAYVKHMPNRHWNRVLIGRYLFNKNISIRDIGLFIRFRINDDEDNQPENVSKMNENLRYFIAPTDDNPRLPPKCSKIQDSSGDFFACYPENSIACKRPYVLQNQITLAVTPNDSKINVEPSVFDIPYVPIDYLNQPMTIDEQNEVNSEVMDNVNILPINVFRGLDGLGTITNAYSNQWDKIETESSFDTVIQNVTDMLMDSSPTMVRKTTRAGFTTTLVIACRQKGLRLLVLEPTNAIPTETFPDAIKIANEQYKLDVTAAIISANTKSCLKVMMKNRQIENHKTIYPNWGSETIQIHNMPFLIKPACSRYNASGNIVKVCEYFDELYPIEPNKIISNSEIIELPVVDGDEQVLKTTAMGGQGICAKNTIVQNINRLDTLFATYAKMDTILMDNSIEGINTRIGIGEFDVVLLDEVSTLIEGRPLSTMIGHIDINGKSSNTTQHYLKQVAMVRDSTKISFQTFIGISDLISETIKVMNRIFYDYKQNRWNNQVNNAIPNTIIRSEIEERIMGYYATIQEIVERENLPVVQLAHLLLIIKSPEWFISANPTIDGSITVSIITRPEITRLRSFLGQLIANGVKILSTDASLPSSNLLPLLQLNNITWKTYDLGDPRKINRSSLIIPDTKNITVTDLNRKTEIVLELDKFVKSICHIHDQKNIMMVFPNKKIATTIGKDFKHNFPGIEITYYRSDKTVGIASDKRIMIAICRPLPPEEAFEWMASSIEHQANLNGLQEMGHRGLTLNLQNFGMNKTFYQTVGRIKDPTGKVPSIVYCFGIRKDDIISMITGYTPLRIYSTTHSISSYFNLQSRIIVGQYWMKKYVEMSPNIARIIEWITKTGSLSISNIKRNLPPLEFQSLIDNLSEYQLIIEKGIIVNENLHKHN
jgi:hypothetical protein